MNESNYSGKYFIQKNDKTKKYFRSNFSGTDISTNQFLFHLHINNDNSLPGK